MSQSCSVKRSRMAPCADRGSTCARNTKYVCQCRCAVRPQNQVLESAPKNESRCVSAACGLIARPRRRSSVLTRVTKGAMSLYTVEPQRSWQERNAEDSRNAKEAGHKRKSSSAALCRGDTMARCAPERTGTPAEWPNRSPLPEKSVCATPRLRPHVEMRR